MRFIGKGKWANRIKVGILSSPGIFLVYYLLLKFIVCHCIPLHMFFMNIELPCFYKDFGGGYCHYHTHLADCSPQPTEWGSTAQPHSSLYKMTMAYFYSFVPTAPSAWSAANPSLGAQSLLIFLRVRSKANSSQNTSKFHSEERISLHPSFNSWAFHLGVPTIVLFKMPHIILNKN
jgi:hypothetical protein